MNEAYQQVAFADKDCSTEHVQSTCTALGVAVSVVEVASVVSSNSILNLSALFKQYTQPISSLAAQIILNKLDLVGAEEAIKVKERIREINKYAKIVPAVKGRVKAS